MKNSKKVSLVAATLVGAAWIDGCVNDAARLLDDAAEIQCPEGLVACAGECRDVANDPVNCGQCGQVCAEDEFCGEGACTLECIGGTVDCGGSCVDIELDPLHCGGCGRACAEGELCSDSMCGIQCLGGATDCNGTCVDTDLDPEHCGGCGMQCPDAMLCSNGMCDDQCNLPTTFCEGACVDTTEDPANCGACGQPCGSGQLCIESSCFNQIVNDGNARRWSDGSYALGCHEYIQPLMGYAYAGATGDAVYTIDPDGAGSIEPFDVFCDMTTDGGGWTLVDNDASNAEAFTTRESGATTDLGVTRGAYLPGYAWSAAPQLLCKSSEYDGTLPWVTLNAVGPFALEYPTATTATTYKTGQWAIGQLNGNTDRGTTAWIYNGGGRFGSVYIGNSGAPTCACNYYKFSPSTGLGKRVSGVVPTCSTWVR